MPILLNQLFQALASISANVNISLMRIIHYLTWDVLSISVNAELINHSIAKSAEFVQHISLYCS